MKYTTEQRDEFLRESNAIEGVFSEEMFEDAVTAWEYLVAQPSLTEEVVLETHRLLMRRSELKPEEVGAYRKCGVIIGGRFGLLWPKIPTAMDGWLAVANYAPHTWKRAHVGYEEIHPFVDGNGRTGRMFMNYMRLRARYPILCIKNSEKKEYYKWFDL